MNKQNGSPHMHGKATRPGKRTLEIDRAQFEAFLTELERDLLTDPCDHTLRRSIAWAQRNGVDVRDFVGLLEEHGGFCDDEVLYNVDPDEVF